MDRSIEDRLRSHIVESFAFGDAAVVAHDAQSLSDAGIVDSSGVLSLILYLEEEFQISVSDDDVLPDNLDSIDKLAQFVRRKSLATGDGG
jgi:acyl carrier protein